MAQVLAAAFRRHHAPRRYRVSKLRLVDMPHDDPNHKTSHTKPKQKQNSVPWMVTLTLLGLWMFLSLTLVKEGDLGARIRPSTLGAPVTVTAAGLLPSGGSSVRRSAAKAAAAATATATAAAAAQGAAAAAAGVGVDNGGGVGGQNGRRASWTRKAVTVGVAQVRYVEHFGGRVCVCVCCVCGGGGVKMRYLGWLVCVSASFG